MSLKLVLYVLSLYAWFILLWFCALVSIGFDASTSIGKILSRSRSLEFTSSSAEFLFNITIFWIWYIFTHRLTATDGYRNFVASVLPEDYIKLLYSAISGLGLTPVVFYWQHAQNAVVYDLGGMGSEFASRFGMFYTFLVFFPSWLILNAWQKHIPSDGSFSVSVILHAFFVNGMGLKADKYTKPSTWLRFAPGKRRGIFQWVRHPKWMMWSTTFWLTPCMTTARLAAFVSMITICTYGARMQDLRESKVDAESKRG